MRLRISTILMLSFMSILTCSGIYNLIKGYLQGDSLLKLAPFIGTIFIIPLYILLRRIDRKSRLRPRPPIPLRFQLAIFPFMFALLAYVCIFAVIISVTPWDGNTAVDISLAGVVTTALLTVLTVLLRSKI